MLTLVLGCVSQNKAMKVLKILSVSLIVVACKVNTFSQQNFTLYNMPVIHQAAYTNPAFIPDRKVSIGLPVISSMYVGVSNSGFKYRDLVTKRADDSLYLDRDNMISKLAKNNYLNFAVQPDLFSFGIIVKKHYFSFNVTEKAAINFRYPKDFFEFIWKGNGAVPGEETNFNFAVNAIHYREYGLGMAYTVNEKLTVGAKLKYLYGMTNIRSVSTDVAQAIDPNTSDITARANIEINTSGLNFNSKSDSATSTSTGSGSEENSFDAKDYLLKRKNSGMGIDLGGTYKLSEKISLSASLIDLGFITWKSGVTNYVSKNPNASYTFSGMDFDTYSGTSEASSAFDSLKNIFSIVETHNNYKTALSSQFYIGANYTLHKKFNVGGLLYGQFFDGSLHPGISISGNARLTKWFSTSLSYSIVNRSYNNIGFGFVLTSPVQFYVVTDNFLALMAPQNTKNFNVRFGINLTFGKNKNKDDDIIPDSKY